MAQWRFAAAETRRALALQLVLALAPATAGALTGGTVLGAELAVTAVDDHSRWSDGPALGTLLAPTLRLDAAIAERGAGTEAHCEGGARCVFSGAALGSLREAAIGLAGPVDRVTYDLGPGPRFLRLTGTLSEPVQVGEGTFDSGHYGLSFVLVPGLCERPFEQLGALLECLLEHLGPEVAAAGSVTLLMEGFPDEWLELSLGGLPRALAASALTAVPEPSTALLLGLGLAGVAARRRSRG
jgi:hypothetical protein